MKRLLIALIALIAGALAGYYLGKRPYAQREQTREVFVDTIRVTAPAPASDSAPVRKDIVRLAVARPQAQQQDSDTTAIIAAPAPDSAIVEVPITRYTFAEDSLYRVSVSGFHVTLDEVEVYPRREIIRVREPAKRWHVGLSVGYGYTPRGMQPFAGVTLTYSLVSF